MKLLAWTFLSAFLLVATGCKPDAAVKRGAVVDQPAPKKEDAPVIVQPRVEQQSPIKKVQ